MNRREFVRRSALTGIGVAISPALSRIAKAQTGLPYIQAYPERPSAYAGEQLVFHVSTTEPEFRITVCRQGATLQPMGQTGWLSASFADARACDTDYQWPGYPVTIDTAWTPGVYVAMFETRRNGVISTPDETAAYGEASKALFVIRGLANPNTRILYKLPFFTYHAYTYGKVYDQSSNFIGGNLVADMRPYYEGGVYMGSRVTLHRPGGGTGGDYGDGGWAWGRLADPYNGASRRNAYSHWDAPFIAWLESNGYAVDYCTDLDLHNEGTSLLDKNRYRIMVSVGNDEYWSQPMRDAMTAYLLAGGNLAFFTGNTGEWQAHVGSDGTFIYCNKDTSLVSGPDHWWDGQYLGMNQLTGGDVRNGGEVAGTHGAWGITVNKASHWVYDGTGLVNGQIFGAENRLISYKVEGARYHHGTSLVELDRNCDDINFDTGPYNTRLLGYYEIGDELAPPPEWSVYPRENPGNFPPLGATMTMYNDVGNVFVAGTSDWARVLKEGEPKVDLITRNVLRMKGSNRIAGVFKLSPDYATIVLQQPWTWHYLAWVIGENLTPSGGDDLDNDSLSADWTIAGAGSFNASVDGDYDLVWQNPADSTLRIWNMNDDLDHIGDQRIDRSGKDRSWSVKGVADFDRDGNADLLWMNSETRDLTIWRMRETEFIEEVRLDSSGIPLDWRLVAVGDLDGDGMPDILWETERGDLAYTIIRDLRRVSDGVIDAPPAQGYTAVGLGDINGDGFNEIVVQNFSTGQILVRLVEDLRWREDVAFNAVA